MSDIIDVNFKAPSNFSNYLSLTLLFLINLFNYSDRYVLYGMLETLQRYYDLNDAQAGLFQTVFLLPYMCFSPIFGYFGDLYSRKKLIGIGIFLWGLSSLASSFVDKKRYVLFYVFRSFVGLGEASICTLSNPLIADIFEVSMRTKTLSFFNVSIPFGSGIGYVLGYLISKSSIGWWWAIRINPIFGLFFTLCLLVIMNEPLRGGCASSTTDSINNSLKNVKFWKKIAHILKKKTYVFFILGYSCFSFSIGSISVWAPKFLELCHASLLFFQYFPTGIVFGLISVLCGIFGTIIGGIINQRLKHKTELSNFILSYSSLCVSSFLLYFALFICSINFYIGLVFTTISMFVINLMWTSLAEIILEIMEPELRSFGNAISIFIIHVLGDATSPSIIGMFSDSLLKRNFDHLVSLQYSLFVCPFMLLLGSTFFYISSKYYSNDMMYTLTRND